MVCESPGDAKGLVSWPWFLSLGARKEEGGIGDLHGLQGRVPVMQGRFGCDRVVTGSF